MNFQLRALKESDEKIIEHFFEKSSDYAILESGLSNPPLEAQSFLYELPPEKDKADKLSYGVFDEKKRFNWADRFS